MLISVQTATRVTRRDGASDCLASLKAVTDQMDSVKTMVAKCFYQFDVTSTLPNITSGIGQVNNEVQASIKNCYNSAGAAATPFTNDQLETLASVADSCLY